MRTAADHSCRAAGRPSSLSSTPPGRDFALYEVPEYFKEKLSPLGQLVEHLAGVLGMDHIHVIPDCVMEQADKRVPTRLLLAELNVLAKLCRARMWIISAAADAGRA